MDEKKLVPEDFLERLKKYTDKHNKNQEEIKMNRERYEKERQEYLKWRKEQKEQILTISAKIFEWINRVFNDNDLIQSLRTILKYELLVVERPVLRISLDLRQKELVYQDHAGRPFWEIKTLKSEFDLANDNSVDFRFIISLYESIVDGSIWERIEKQIQERIKANDNYLENLKKSDDSWRVKHRMFDTVKSEE